MKKIFGIILCLLIGICVFAACGENGSGTETAQTEEELIEYLQQCAIAEMEEDLIAREDHPERIKYDIGYISWDYFDNTWCEFYGFPLNEEYYKYIFEIPITKYYFDRYGDLERSETQCFVILAPTDGDCAILEHR